MDTTRIRNALGKLVHDNALAHTLINVAEHAPPNVLFEDWALMALKAVLDENDVLRKQIFELHKEKGITMMIPTEDAAKLLGQIEPRKELLLHASIKAEIPGQ